MRLLHSLFLVLPIIQNVASAPTLEQDNSPLADHSPIEKRDGKYFHEAGADYELGHYDRRYFKGKVPYDQHAIVLRHLMRSYLIVMKKLKAETWIAHGTLLGWWWNGLIMPWDNDLDTQVSSATLYYLAKNHNMTLHKYEHEDAKTGKTITKEYLLDINPRHVDKTRGNGLNVIDARWIDTSNGMYADITGLAERDDNKPGIWSCKNFHDYRTSDLYPMRESEFEGVPVLIPYNFDGILAEEYGRRALVSTEHRGHHWDGSRKLWVKQS